MRRTVLVGMAAGVVVLLLVWYFALFSPLAKDLGDTHKKLTAGRQTRQDLRATVARLEELSANAPKQQALLRALNGAVPETPDLAGFILSANEIAAASGIDWLSVSPTPPAASAAGGPSTISMTIQIQGGYYQVLDYLNRFEGLGRLVIVDGVNVSAKTASAAGTGATGATGASGATGATGAAPSPSSSSSSAAPDLSVTLNARMFTRAAPLSTTPGSPTAPGGGGGSGSTTPTTAPGTTPTTAPAGTTPTTRAGST